jgi:hypothetical protein
MQRRLVNIDQGIGPDRPCGQLVQPLLHRRNEHVFVYNQSMESNTVRKMKLTKALQAAEAELGLARMSGNRHRMVAANAAYKRALTDYESDPQLGTDPRL